MGIFNIFEVVTTCAIPSNTDSWDELFTGIVDTDGNRLYSDIDNTLILQKKDSSEIFNDWVFFKIINRPQILCTYRYQTLNVDYDMQFEDFLIISGENKLEGFNIIKYYQGHY